LKNLSPVSVGQWGGYPKRKKRSTAPLMNKKHFNDANTKTFPAHVPVMGNSTEEKIQPLQIPICRMGNFSHGRDYRVSPGA
jgi:hypothetical protein